MEHDAQMVVRLPKATAERLKEYAAKLSREFGVRVSVAEATRKLITDGLDAADTKPSTDAGARAKPKKR